MKIKNYRPFDKGFLCGFATIVLENYGNIEICDIAVFKKDNQKWISFPQKTYEKDGKKVFYPYVKFPFEKMKTITDQFFDELENWIKENPILAPKEALEQISEEIPF